MHSAARDYWEARGGWDEENLDHSTGLLCPDCGEACEPDRCPSKLWYDEDGNERYDEGPTWCPEDDEPWDWPEGRAPRRRA